MIGFITIKYAFSLLYMNLIWLLCSKGLIDPVLALKFSDEDEDRLAKNL